MSDGKAKYDPLEAAKLGTEKPAAPKAATPTKPEPPKEAPPKKVDSTAIEEFETPPGKARKGTGEKEATPAPPTAKPKYRLLKDKRVSIRGMICDFKAGRVFDAAGYDIDNLRAQGLELELIKE